MGVERTFLLIDGSVERRPEPRTSLLTVYGTLKDLRMIGRYAQVHSKSVREGEAPLVAFPKSLDQTMFVNAISEAEAIKLNPDLPNTYEVCTLIDAKPVDEEGIRLYTVTWDLKDPDFKGMDHYEDVPREYTRDVFVDEEGRESFIYVGNPEVSGFPEVVKAGLVVRNYDIEKIWPFADLDNRLRQASAHDLDLDLILEGRTFDQHAMRALAGDLSNIETFRSRVPEDMSLLPQTAKVFSRILALDHEPEAQYAGMAVMNKYIEGGFHAP